MLAIVSVRVLGTAGVHGPDGGDTARLERKRASC
jgi:hypothetical protein